MWVSPHTTGMRGNAGHSPVGGDSLLMEQAGGGSCTRSGELKLRRKEEDCGKSGQREGIERSRPLRAWPSPSPSTPRPEESALSDTQSPGSQAWEHQSAISTWSPLTVLPGHCWREISSEHQRWTLTLHVLHRKPCLEFPAKNKTGDQRQGVVRIGYIHGQGAKEVG